MVDADYHNHIEEKKQPRCPPTAGHCQKTFASKQVWGRLVANSDSERSNKDLFPLRVNQSAVQFAVPMSTIKSMIEQGQDPKDMVHQQCKPECTAWSDKLKRCENKLRSLVNADPEMSCMYPLRDWVTCLEACTQPKIIKHLAGAQPGRFF